MNDIRTRIKKYVAIGNAHGTFWALGSFATLKEAVEWIELNNDSDREPVFRNAGGSRECEIGNDLICTSWEHHYGSDFADNIRLADKMRASGKWHNAIHEAQITYDEHGYPLNGYE